MKNTHIFDDIERRSKRGHGYGMHERLSAACKDWIPQLGHIPLIRVAREMNVPYDKLVDRCTEEIQSYFPDVNFPEKRPQIETVYLPEELERRAAACYRQDDNDPTFELFYYIANPNPMPDMIIAAPDQNLRDHGQ